ncbi:MAG: hypothetical protein R6X12_08120 [bacterium]
MTDAVGRPAETRLAAYNLQNLGREDNPGGVYEQKLEFLAGALRSVNADLVAVAEVREEASFGELVRAAGDYPEALLSDLTPDRRQLQVGLFTRLPVLDRGQWHDFPAALPGEPGRLVRLGFRRAIPWLRVRLPDGSTLLAAAVHLKSGRPEVENVPETESPRRREVLGMALATAGRIYEAAGLRCRLDEAMARPAADHFAVLGDFNDGPGSEVVQLVLGRVHAVIEGPSPVAGELFEAAERIAPELRVSYFGRGQEAQLDHILVSKELDRRLVAAGIETQLIDRSGRWQAGARVIGYPRSDHAPVWAAFGFAEDTGGAQ